MKLQKVACNTDYTVYLDIYFMLDTAKVASSSRHFTLIAQCIKQSSSRPRKLGKKREFSVLKRLSLPCYFTTLKPNKCDQTARAEKDTRRERRKRDRKRGERIRKSGIKSQKRIRRRSPCVSNFPW